jgi:hypothetical protein
MNAVRAKKSMHGFTVYIDCAKDRVILRSRDGVGKYSLKASESASSSSSSDSYVPGRARLKRDGVTVTRR